jgi:PPOX class probable F420-dependent enzyme
MTGDEGNGGGAVVIPATHRDLLAANGFAYVATTGPRGWPQVTPTWYLWDEASEQLLISLTTSRQKYRNLQRDPHLAVCIADLTNPYRHIEIRGTCAIEPDTDRALINGLARKYLSTDRFTQDGPDDTRMVIRIHPDQARCFG